LTIDYKLIYNHYQYRKGDEREKSLSCPQGESAVTESAFGITGWWKDTRELVG